MSDFAGEVRALRSRGDVFASDAPIFIARAPGRLDLMGGNDDYTGGMVFEATIREATWAAAQARHDRTIVLVNPQMQDHGWQARVEISLDELTDEACVRAIVNREPSVRWTAYVLGVLFWLKQNAPALVTRGVTILLRSDVPLNKGVSSSAAVEVATLKAAAKVFGSELAGIELAEACQWAENVIAESACGIMDQIAVVLGDEGYVLPLVCQPCLPRPLVRLSAGLICWGIDSGVSHQVSGLEYEAARAAAFMGYKLICDREGIEITFDERAKIPRWTDPRFNGYLANLPPSLYRAYEDHLPDELSGSEYLRICEVHVDPFTQARPAATYRIRACTRYAVEENHRVQLFGELARGMNDGFTIDGATLLGELMYQSHAAYSETGLGCDKTDLIVELAREQGPSRGIFGAKITGGGGGGTVAVLGASDATDALTRIVDRYREQTGIDPYVFRGSSPGADRFGIVELKPE
ncbi:MAG TPA: galactokinase family protein [Pirellulales bacterium]|nr:galactokinase family protein [Pirellulales bacterium]